MLIWLAGKPSKKLSLASTLTWWRRFGSERAFGLPPEATELTATVAGPRPTTHFAATLAALATLAAPRSGVAETDSQS